MANFSVVPKKGIFDNGKVAEKDSFGARARKQAGYAILSAHYGFEAIFCNPASGNEKGLVEGLVGYICQNVCVPIPRMGTLEQLNAMLLKNVVITLPTRSKAKRQMWELCSLRKDFFYILSQSIPLILANGLWDG